MTELIAVIVVVGILSVFAMARLNEGFATTRGFYDRLLSQVQYARKVAVAQRRPVFVRIDVADSRLCYVNVAACTGADGVPSATGEVPFRVAIPGGVAVMPLPPIVFQFDGLGRYRNAAGAATITPLVVSVIGEGTLQFTVWHETGYVQ